MEMLRLSVAIFVLALVAACQSKAPSDEGSGQREEVAAKLKAQDDTGGDTSTITATATSTASATGGSAGSDTTTATSGASGSSSPATQPATGTATTTSTSVQPAPPPTPFGGNVNYVMVSPVNPGVSPGCKNLKDVSVTIKIEEDIVSNIGFGFQLNATSPSGRKVHDGEQQFVLWVGAAGGPGGRNSPAALWAMIEPWPQKGPGDVVNWRKELNPLPTTTLRKGTELTITLRNDSHDNVRWVTFKGSDKNGDELFTPPEHGDQPFKDEPTVDIRGLQLDCSSGSCGTYEGSGKYAAEEDLSPIVAFQLVLVGPINSQEAYLSSGAGTITYSASKDTPLTPMPYGVDVPTSCTDDPIGTGTAEDANSAYYRLPDVVSTKFRQYFYAKKLPEYAAGAALAVSRLPVGLTSLFTINKMGEMVMLASDVPSVDNIWGPEIQLSGSGLFHFPIVVSDPVAYLAASPQLVGGRTGVFMVDQNNCLDVFWVDGSKSWDGPHKLDTGCSLNVGSPLAVSLQFGVPNQPGQFVIDYLNMQTDVFIVDQKNVLNVYSLNVNQNNSSMPPLGDGVYLKKQVLFPKPTSEDGFASGEVLPVGAPLAVANPVYSFDETDVFVVTSAGQLARYWVTGDGEWSKLTPILQTKIGQKGNLPSNAYLAASLRYSGIVYTNNVFAVSGDGQLNVYYDDGKGSWSGFKTIGETAYAPPGAPLATSQEFDTLNRTDVFLVNDEGQLVVFSNDTGEDWSAPLPISNGLSMQQGGQVFAMQDASTLTQTDVFAADALGGLHIFWVDGVAGDGVWHEQPIEARQYVPASPSEGSPAE